jgi:putative FmdB family regulatory protein
MPIYEYKCQQCGSSFEQIRSIAERDKDLLCPKCHSTRVERQLSVFSYGTYSGTLSGDACGWPSAGHG